MKTHYRRRGRPVSSGRETALVTALALALVISAGNTGAEAKPYEPFFGKYVGEAISESDGQTRTRDLTIEIKPSKNGFTVDWMSVTHNASGKVKRREHSVEFSSTDRENIFSSAMRRDVFGHAVPLNPIRGDPYFWARIDGPTLSVFALHITEDGGYEVQEYHRTLTPEGMTLRYTRVREGTDLRTVNGTLKRTR